MIIDKIIFGECPLPRCGAAIDTTDRVMYLDIKHMITESRREEMPFEERFSNSISHEIIHQILFDIEGACATSDFENLCYRRCSQFKLWFGGIGPKYGGRNKNE